MLTHDNAAELRRLVLVGLRRRPSRIASAATRRSTSICRCSTSTSAIKHGGDALSDFARSSARARRISARFIADNRLTVWYSTPSILTLLAQFGGLEAHDCSTPAARALRRRGVPGEAPARGAAALAAAASTTTSTGRPRPTSARSRGFRESCPTTATRRIRSGSPCAHCDAAGARRRRAGGRRAATRACCTSAGRRCSSGYWNRPVENAAAFLERDGRAGTTPATSSAGIRTTASSTSAGATGWSSGAATGSSSARSSAASTSTRRCARRRSSRCPTRTAGVKIVAFLSCHDGARPSIIEMKTFCGTGAAGLHEPGSVRLPRRAAADVDRQGGLPGAAPAGLRRETCDDCFAGRRGDVLQDARRRAAESVDLWKLAVPVVGARLSQRAHLPLRPREQGVPVPGDADDVGVCRPLLPAASLPAAVLPRAVCSARSRSCSARFRRPG